MKAIAERAKAEKAERAAAEAEAKKSTAEQERSQAETALDAATGEVAAAEKAFTKAKSFVESQKVELDAEAMAALEGELQKLRQEAEEKTQQQAELQSRLDALNAELGAASATTEAPVDAVAEAAETPATTATEETPPVKVETSEEMPEELKQAEEMEKTEAAKENMEDLDIKELGKRLTQLGKDSRADGEALEKAIAEAAEDPSRVEEVAKLRNKIGEDRESFLSASGAFLKKLSQEKPGMVEQQYRNIDAVLERMDRSLGRSLKEESPTEDSERKSYSIGELVSKLQGVDALIKAQNPDMEEKELEGKLIDAQLRVIDKTSKDEKDPGFKALMQGLYDRSRKTRFVYDDVRKRLRTLSS